MIMRNEADINGNDYIDDMFEQPFAEDGKTLSESIELEKTEIDELQKIIGHYVKEMAKNREKWKSEHILLKQEFGNRSFAFPVLLPARRRRLRRYRNLKRIFGDLPQRATFATRDVHRKTTGGLAGRFQVRKDLEPDLAKGLFQPGAIYDAVVRCSNGNPRAKRDRDPDARGFAVKLLPAGTLPHDDASGAVVKQWLSGHQEREIDPSDINRMGVLDIVTINFPCFFINNPLRYGEVNKDFLKITDDEDAKLEQLATDFKAVYLGAMTRWERELALNVNGSVIYHPLYQKYYSMAPSRLGAMDDPERTAVKYVWDPCTGGKCDELIKVNNPPWADRHDYAHLTRQLHTRFLNEFPEDLKQDRDHLRAMVAKSLDPRAYEADPSLLPVCFDLKVQKFIDEANTSIEDTTSIWLESEEQRREWVNKARIPADEKEAVRTRKISAFRTIGTLSISPLPWSEIEPTPEENGVPRTRNRRYIEDLSFNPWNNVPEEHRPLGVVQRMKRQVYASSRSARLQINQVPDSLEVPEPSRVEAHL